MRGTVSKNIAVFSLVFRPLSCGHLALSLWACAERKYSVKHMLVYWRLGTGKTTYPQAVRKEKQEGKGNKRNYTENYYYNSHLYTKSAADA